MTKGFTLIETIVVIGLIGVFLAVTPVLYRSSLSNTISDTATETIVEALRRSRFLAQSVRGDSTWGVSITSTGATIFKGASYASRDTLFDEVYSFSRPVTVSGATEVVFGKVSGTTTASTMTLSASEGAMQTITINAKGTVTY